MKLCTMIYLEFVQKLELNLAVRIRTTELYSLKFQAFYK